MTSHRLGREQAAKVRTRDLNDRFRQHAIGSGSILATSGVHALGEPSILDVLNAVREFSAFSGDDDPWGEHDFGAFELGDVNLFWKIDYFDRTVTVGSPDPSDEKLTHRVLMIMLAEEY